MDNLPAVVWLCGLGCCVTSRRSGTMKTPALVLTPEVLADLRVLDETGMCGSGFTWLRAALEAATNV